MQTIKGLIALLLVALAVFIVVETYNRYAEARYIAQLKNMVVASPAQTANQTPAAMAPGTASQARQKNKNASL